jgi:hypothetical protein
MVKEYGSGNSTTDLARKGPLPKKATNDLLA